MIPQPLHPAIVHFPIVLAFLLPLAVIGAIIALRRGVRARIAWGVVTALALALFASAFVSLKTGEAQEEAVEDVLTSEQPMHAHEEAAERFLALAGLTLALAPLGLLKGRFGQTGRAVFAVSALALLPAVYSVGHSGGKLVYQYGAGQAYTASTTAQVTTAETDDESEEDDQRERRSERPRTNR
jgi:uncharacterized membrane protein